MLYASQANVKFEAFKNYKVPKREGETSYWEGVAHQDLVRGVRKVAKERDLKITKEEFQLGNGRDTLFASWDFDRKVPGVKGAKMCLGYRGSNIGRYAHTFATGARVGVCENGMISGEFALRRKHTTAVNLLELIGCAFDQYLLDIKKIKPLIASLQRKNLNDSDAAEIMLESARRGIIGWSRIRIVDKDWREPRYPAFEADTGWTLYNNFTQSAKITTPAQQIAILRDIPQLILDYDKAGWPE